MPSVPGQAIGNILGQPKERKSWRCDFADIGDGPWDDVDVEYSWHMACHGPGNFQIIHFLLSECITQQFRRRRQRASLCRRGDSGMKNSIKWPKHHKAIPCYHINDVSCANTHPRQHSLCKAAYKQEMINNAIPATTKKNSTIICQNESMLPAQVPSTSINHRRLGVVSLWMDRGLEAAAANTRWRVQPCLAAKMVT